MKSCKTFKCSVFSGLKEGYDGQQHDIYEAEKVIQDYCDTVGLCVTATPTKYIYTNGSERGVEVGLINYPRFESTPEKIMQHADAIASRLMLTFKQHRVSIVHNDGTTMLEESDFTQDGEE